MVPYEWKDCECTQLEWPSMTEAKCTSAEEFVILLPSKVNLPPELEIAPPS